MKRKIVFWLGSALIIFSFLTVLGSCRKIVEDTLQERCDNSYDEASEAYSDFLTNPTEASCEEFKDKWDDYTDDCFNSAYYNAALDNAFDDLDCSQYGK